VVTGRVTDRVVILLGILPGDGKASASINAWRYADTMVVALLLIVLAGFASAQTNEDPRVLLQETAASAHAAKSWLAEGMTTSAMTGQGMRIHSEIHFKIAFERPSKMRLEIDTNETIGGMPPSRSGTLMVCDGIDHWTHYSPGTTFSRATVGVSACRPEFGDYSNLTENVVSATLSGEDQVQFAGKAQECKLVLVEYATVPGSERYTRTLCVDPIQHLVLRDVVERRLAPDRVLVETTTYSSYVRNSALAADTFRFHVPTGTFEDDGPQPDLIVENGVYHLGAPISPPTLVSKTEPAVTPDAPQPGISGVVVVSLQVNPDGQPSNIRTERGLGHGFDEKAVESVRQWRFNPGTKDGAPVAVGPVKVAVNFP